MNTTRPCLTAGRLLCAVLLTGLGGCRLTRMPSPALSLSGLIAPHPSRAAAELFAELGGEEAFVQITRHLYRWYLDEDDFKRFNRDPKHQLWLRTVETVADPEDRSRYLEMVLPAIGVMVSLKKTDYRIPELKLTVRSDGYRITQICRDTCRRQVLQRDYAVMDLNLDALYERLFQTRLERTPPGEALLNHLLAETARQIAALAETPAATEARPPDPDATVFVAPISVIANEAWVFWEEGKLLFRFSSDLDLANPELRKTGALDIRLYNAVEQTVVSHEERPCDDRFITRDQIGRALYNCVILGQRHALPAGRP